MLEKMTSDDIQRIANMLASARPELIQFAETVTKENQSRDYYEGFVDALNTVQTLLAETGASTFLRASTAGMAALAADRYIKADEFPSEI